MKIYLGLGSNYGNRRENLSKGLQLLRAGGLVIEKSVLHSQPSGTARGLPGGLVPSVLEFGLRGNLRW